MNCGYNYIKGMSILCYDKSRFRGEMMSIKFRLLFSYIAMLVIPIVLSLLAAIIIRSAVFGSSANANFFKFGNGPQRRLLTEGTDVFNDIKFTASNNPEVLKDARFLNSIDKKLMIINTGLVVRRENKIVYTSRILSGVNFSNELPQFGATDEYRHDPVLVGNKVMFIRQHDFYFTNKQKGSVFLLTDVSTAGQNEKKFMGIMVAVVTIILVLTNSILTYLVSKSIVNPLVSLKHAAEQIKMGNLDCEVKIRSSDEIGELGEAFEEMRRQLKYSMDQKIQYENNRKELISSISHDLKTPITAIKGYIEGIMDGVADSKEKMERYIKTIYSKSNDLDKMIDELFLFSKLDLKRVPFNFERIDIKKYLADCIEEFQFDMEKKNISMKLNIEYAGELMVIGDREKIKRVVTNIINNAIKYMDKQNSKIDINLSSDAEYATIEVHDNGHGISKESLPYVFDSFYRADPSRNSKTGGSGLGLAIAKRIIEEHGGKIWASSEYGNGTSIYFTLKRADREREQ